VPIQKLYEIPEFAELTGLEVSTTRQYVSRGLIKALYLGRRRMIPASEVERICTEGLQTSHKTRTKEVKAG
jgi:excisionase family DNA binding protein